MLSKEDLEGVELLWHALDVIETIDTNNQLDAFKLACERSDTLLDILLLEAFDELLGIDTDREGTDSDEFAIIIDAIRCSRGLTVEMLVQACRGSHASGIMAASTYRILEQLLRKCLA